MRTLLPLLCLFAFFYAGAQDGNYWHSPYGTGGFFLPGSVIAYNGDSGVYFTNPALLANSPKTTISVTAVLYQMQTISMADGAGTGRKLISKNMSSVPQMVAGKIALGKNKFPLAYAIIHNPLINFAANQRRDEQLPVLNDAYSPGAEYFLGQYVEQNRASETQLQISTGKKLAPHFTAGLTLEANLYSRYFSSDFSATAIVNPGIADFNITSNRESYIANYKNYGARAKVGIGYDNGNHHLGLTITTPVLHLKGDGNITSDITLVNAKLDPDLSPLSLFANARQVELKAKWKMPLSIALGYLYRYNKNQLYVAAEYFGQINEYDVIAPDNDVFIRPDTGNYRDYTYSLLRLKDARKAVLNVAVGNSFYINPQYTAFLSLRTNFSYIDKSLFANKEGFIPYTSSWNNYHMQVGVNTKRKNVNIKAGLFLALGFNGDYDQVANFDNPTDSNFLQGSVKTVKANHFSAGVMLSYIHNL
ncbi:hypothetical protein I5907_07030 [Panacibacter sp. DH6]|uniref:Long-chain fatty acid transport protein n=1 Tax=Panacibacter microcysteis TaxID=2793269 RepID=A0A931E5P4_9BACT|nr:hypothetical protein [Panacibacter microcysteis]MBG9375981.1 hypothetical protein [Panacibacter microcysteis]